MLALSDRERQALEDALDDEYRAQTTYAQVIHDFGSVRPFIHIVEAEARHVSALRSLFDAYGIAVPANRWPGHVPRFASVQEACAAGVLGEIDNVAIYDRALRTTERADILAVYHALRSASLERHLPAFRRGARQPSPGGPS